MLYGLDNRVNSGVEENLLQNTHTFVHYHSCNALSVRQRSEYFICIFPTFCSQDPPLDLQNPGKEGGKRGVSYIASNKGLIWRKLGTFRYPFSSLAASDVAKASAKGGNSGVVQSFTNPYTFKVHMTRNFFISLFERAFKMMKNGVYYFFFKRRKVKY